MHQEFTEMKMDDGNVSRRPKASPFPIFKGTVVLNEAEKTALDRFCETGLGRHFSFSNPRTGTTVHATFMQAPFVRSTRIVEGAHATYEVEFIFRDTTDLIKRAFEHGVMTSA